MYPKQSSRDGDGDGDGDGDDGTGSLPVRTSDRLRRRPKPYGPRYTFYASNMVIRKRRKSKSRTRMAAVALAKSFGQRHSQTSNVDQDGVNLRRSTRKRRVPINLESCTDSYGTDDNDMMNCKRPSHSRPVTRNHHVENDNGSQDELPRRQGLRPRLALRSRYNLRIDSGQLNSGSEDDKETSVEKIDQDEAENENDEYNEADNGEGEEDAGGDGDEEDEGEEDAGGDGDEEDEGEDEGEEDGEGEEGEGQEARRRYDLRNRTDVRRLSVEEGKQRPRSPRRVLQQGMGPKVNRDVRRGGSRVHKRHRLTRAEDSDDSLLLDEGPPAPWSRGGSRSGPPPWLMGGLDMHGPSAWGLNVTASGWVHQSDAVASLTPGIQTAGPSSKGGADIQPVQIDESVSFDDIGGLSEYIDALKEMVFFPLLYPDFFASYNITPPRGVLLCGPPGTGKTLIARALACSASKAGQKVSFYMRKGADVLSKWVGEAERQLKLLFEEAQRNQPSIIFFDEIDGLAPVRSSKQEQIHNSIVSTLLALMDGLDSRGQVVLIGATNRVDAIDGALRRPGRFDREFNFPLPGIEARAEILEIHTRKWKQPLSNDLKSELAANCVGYCGADLKALCTEAAICAFREKYPQVYTSDDKFLIDVDSVKVEKLHFITAMSTITPAAHRGSIVHSRPLSSVVAPCLQAQYQKAMSIVFDIFPLAAAASSSLESTKLSPLVYRPRFLLCGSEGAGLDHVGPAILHELEKFPVHSLGLPSLLSDPGAKTAEEALVHIFAEARRKTPSILYLPQFHLWWENAHEQLKAVLLTLLKELPSDLAILLLGTSSVQRHDLLDNHFAIFPTHSIFCIDTPSTVDRSLFFDKLIEAALSIHSKGTTRVSLKSNQSEYLPELPKAPKVTSAPKASELKAKAESQEHSLRRLRMCLRDVCNRILYDKRFSAFHYPVMDEDAPNYRTIIQNPMDMATLLQRVDSGCYITSKSFLEDFDFIVMNAKKYNGDDYKGARIVSRAHELRDAVHGMLSQMDPALVSFCEKIAEEGGPISVSQEFEGLAFLPQTTRASARLRNVQPPEVDLDQSYEVLKRPKRNVDSTTDYTLQEPKAAGECNADGSNFPVDGGNFLVDGGSQPKSCVVTTAEDSSQDVTMSDIFDKLEETIKLKLLEHTQTWGIPQLERLHARIMNTVSETKIAVKGGENLRSLILNKLLMFADNESNFV